mgnify:FL=1
MSSYYQLETNSCVVCHLNTFSANIVKDKNFNVHMTLFRLFIRCTSIETKSLSIESTEAGNNHSVKTASSVCNRKETLLQINIYRVSTTIPCRQTYSSYLHNLKNATYIYICSLLIFVLSLLCEWVCAWYHLGLRKQKNKNTLMTAIRHSYSYTHTHIYK